LVLDSSAIVAIFKQESGYELLEQKIDAAERIFIGAPTLVETGVVLSRMIGADQRPVLESWLRRIGAEVVAFNEIHYLLASDAFLRFGRGFHSRAALNFGDCLSYAVSAATGHPLLFIGDDFAHTDVARA
jgi:ribonuclease VapC